MSRRRRLLLAALALALLLPLAGVGYAAWLGWFGGPLYRYVPATVAAPPRERGTAAVLWSGDAGFKVGMAPEIMAGLAARGVPVLAVNTLVAFRHGRAPDAARALVAATVRRALAIRGTTRVVLIGRSFGADMVQFAAADLPADLRRHVAQVLLVVPGDTIVFTAVPGGLVEHGPAIPAIPSARRIGWAPVLCVYGREEPDSLCPLLHGPSVRIVALPGDHYLDHDPDALVSVLWAAIRRGR